MYIAAGTELVSSKVERPYVPNALEWTGTVG